MSDYIEQKVIDEYKEHLFHSLYNENCSSCYNKAKDNLKVLVVKVLIVALTLFIGFKILLWIF